MHLRSKGELNALARVGERRGKNKPTQRAEMLPEALVRAGLRERGRGDVQRIALTTKMEGTRGVKCPEWAPDVCSDSIVAPSDSCQAGIVPG